MRAAQVDRHLVRLAVLESVVHPFLNNPKQAQGQIVRQRRRDRFVRESNIHLASRQLVAKRVESGNQTKQAQPGGMQTVRQILHALGNAPHARHRFVGLASRFLRPGAVQERDLYRQQRELLANVVVQLSRNVRALHLLRCNQSAGQVLNLFVARAQLPLARLERFLRCPSVRDVDARADVPVEASVRQSTRHPGSEQPPVLRVCPLYPALHPKRLAPRKCVVNCNR